jgi:hypothetical protein
MRRIRLEEYNVAIQAFHDSLNGLDSALGEALLRCDKARLACGEARLVYEDEQAKRVLPHCPVRDAIQEQYLLAVLAYGDALGTIELRPRMWNEGEREGIERARAACQAAFKALEDHERKHRCARATSTRGRTKASSS